MTKTRDGQSHTGSSLSEQFDILSSPYRRRILVAVANRNPRDEDELRSEGIADDDENLDVFEQKLYHNHLPKLDAAGFIDWNRETGTITRGPRFDEIRPLIKLMTEHQDELPAGWP
ncbi:helix-turn-helix domain-containing protein [Salinirubrum litoreum]|uniref:Helix-turn-helix domain-containing protein n=1 Tax=Salinirubrum litoreum TaxID=1126234 RepID=A0ABD5RG13_9EURY|nr:helix-turn-helix domain-containing protein [Salinirubrum litoreum]